jgi:hypothetical protein
MHWGWIPVPSNTNRVSCQNKVMTSDGMIRGLRRAKGEALFFFFCTRYSKKKYKLKPKLSFMLKEKKITIN